jgi:hypothetical protein
LNTGASNPVFHFVWGSGGLENTVLDTWPDAVSTTTTSTTTTTAPTTTTTIVVPARPVPALGALGIPLLAAIMAALGLLGLYRRS